MADITGYPFLRHVHSTATSHVRHLRRDRVLHDGPAQAFWFRPRTATLSEIPIDDRELSFVAHARTSDVQDLAVATSLSYRIADPALAASRVDFSIEPRTGRWRRDPLEQVGELLTQSAQQYALDALAHVGLAAAVAAGPEVVRAAISTGLATDPRLAETGVVVLGVRVVSIRPDPEVEKALQTPLRQSVQQEADRATYERRAMAVERERTIAENELTTQIELARRQEQLLAQRGANARREAQDAAAATSIGTAAQAEGIRAVGEAEAAAEAAHLEVYAQAPDVVVLAHALSTVAAKLPKIDHLVLTPELLTPLLARLATPATGSR